MGWKKVGRQIHTVGAVTEIFNPVRYNPLSQPFTVAWTNDTGQDVTAIVGDPMGVIMNVRGWINDPANYVNIVQSGVDVLNRYVLRASIYFNVEVDGFSYQVSSAQQAIQPFAVLTAGIDGNVQQDDINIASLLRNDMYQLTIIDFYMRFMLNISTALAIGVLDGETISITYFPRGVIRNYNL